MGNCRCATFERITMSNMDMDRCKYDLDYCIECAHVYFKALDSDFDGKITFEDFCSKNKIKNYPLAKLKASFKQLDRNNSGFIDEFEFTMNFCERYYSALKPGCKLGVKDIIDVSRLDTDEKYC